MSRTLGLKSGACLEFLIMLKNAFAINELKPKACAKSIFDMSRNSSIEFEFLEYPKNLLGGFL
ncbi:MAG: hypothetical protein AABY00_03745 [Nanoarchaeota archaeon]